MSLGRRGFLQFCLGAGAGITFSPLPWKLMDDSAIWTQNWPWTPVPPGGEVSIEKTACTLCPGGCGITVRKVKDRAIKIEGMKGHPINDGGVCLLGMSALYKLYGGARIKGPLKRAGKKVRKKFCSFYPFAQKLSSRICWVTKNSRRSCALDPPNRRFCLDICNSM